MACGRQTGPETPWQITWHQSRGQNQILVINRFPPSNCDLYLLAALARRCCRNLKKSRDMRTYIRPSSLFSRMSTNTTQTLQSGLVPAAADARWRSSLTPPFSYSSGSSLSWDMRWAFVERFAPFSLGQAGPVISALRWAYFLTGLRHN